LFVVFEEGLFTLKLADLLFDKIEFTKLVGFWDSVEFT